MRFHHLGFWIILSSFLTIKLAQGGELELVSCWFTPPHKIEAQCFRLAVKENRQSENSKILKLPIIKLRHKENNPKLAPVLYIPGGPGDGGWLDVDRIGFWWDFIDENDWLKEREVILYDPRGTGLVEPRMDCPEIENLVPQILTFNREYKKAGQLSDEASRHCYNRLIKEGFDPKQYNSAMNAQDLHELFLALKIKEWNLYGLSYGTHFALTYARDYPTDIKAMILDSVIPPEVNFFEDYAWLIYRAMDYLAQTCARSSPCQTYGDLNEKYRRIIERLNKQPVLLSVDHPYRSGKVKILLTGDLFVDFVFINLYSRPNIETLPSKIAAIDEGDEEALVEAASDIASLYINREDFGEAMNQSVHCNEEAPFNNIEKMRAQFRRYSLLAPLVETIDTLEGECESWFTIAGDIKDNQPVKSNIPTLLLTGGFDPVTPPVYAKSAAKNLTRSFLFEFPHVGHDVLSYEPCADLIAKKFLDDPEHDPKDSCFDDLPSPVFN